LLKRYGYLCISKKFKKRPIGENSSNLVTLLAMLRLLSRGLQMEGGQR
jgi:hypothetical protein